LSQTTTTTSTWPADPLLDASLPLSRMKVIDVTVSLAGPCAAEMLGDMGADVIKIESPSLTGDQRGNPPVVGGESGGFLLANRNKRSLSLNLNEPRGREILLELANSADVLIENLRPGALERLGLGYEAVRRVNPAIIYASISGFGQTSPYAGLGSFDGVAQAMSGLMLSIGEDGHPPVKAGIPLPSVGASIFTGYGILTAYIYRQKTGLGQFIDTALLDVPIALQVKQMLYYFLNQKVPDRMGGGDMDKGPYRAFQTKDGALTLGGTNANLWPKMCAALGVEELVSDPRFETPPLRRTNGAELTAILTPILKTKTTEQWLASLRENGVPSGPVNRIDQTVADPQVQAREMIIEVEHPQAGKVKMASMPIKLGRTPGKIRRPPPMLGEHTAEILAGMGRSPGQISELQRDSVI
jgi:CoA:oxalate CoA-transferase